MPVPSSLTLPKGEGVEDKPLEKSSLPNTQQSGEDNHKNKLFVGALNSETTKETLESYFSSYGEILECTIMKDQNKSSRGFGFITFKDPESVQKILCSHADEPIVIDDKTIDPKLAVPRSRHPKPTYSNSQARRIFVGGLSSDTGEEDIRTFFLQFGNIEEVQLMYDKHTNRHRGFAFVTFEKIEPALEVCRTQFHDLKNKKVEVKVAQSKEALALQQADKECRAASAVGHSYSSASPFNFSPTYPPFFSPPYMAYYGGYHGYHGDHHLPSPPFYPPGFNGVPSPFHFMRGSLPDHSPLPLSSPDYLSDHFQGLAIISNPYVSPTGSPPHGFPPFTNGGGGPDGSYSPPTVKDKPNTSTINGYSQVSNYQSSQTSGSFLSSPQQPIKVSPSQT